MLSKGECKMGDDCNLAHSVFEYWMHPEKFRTKFCKDGPDCKRAVCFFAHSRQELRNPSTDYKARSLTSDCSQHLQQLAQAINSSSISGQDLGNPLSRYSISSPGSHSSSTTLLSPSAPSFATAFPAHTAFPGDAGIGYNFSPIGMQANPQYAAANLPMLMMNSSVAGSMADSRQHGARRMLMLNPQQAGPSHMAAAAAAPLQDVQQMPDTGSAHAAHVAALQMEYDDRVRKAELAAARAEATGSTLQAVVAALGRSASSGTTLHSPPLSGTRPVGWPVQQHTQAAAHGAAVELPAVQGGAQQFADIASSSQYHQGLLPVFDASGAITYLHPGLAPQPSQQYAVHGGQYGGGEQAVSYDLELMGVGQRAGKNAGQSVVLQPGNPMIDAVTGAAAAASTGLEGYGGSEGVVRNADVSNPM
eukprot:GHUV01026210.1.p1 GENE.GHUV01026210.1~~GHUV01026210.1.p1  ORF type:complete len:419 (+),score=122.31 GHUV01026210.1:955-2211(+)